MARFTPKTHDQILATMIAQAVARTNLSDVGDSSVLKHILSAAARSDSQQYYQMSLLLQLFSIDTAAGEDLDERAKDIQPGTIARLVATQAVGTVVFSRRGTTGTVLIPVGTKVKTSDGISFSTTALGEITAASAEQITGHGVGRDSVPIPCIADLGGASGNVTANTITKFSNKPAGVDEVTNPNSTQYGRDLESDDSFRARIKAFIASLPRCTPNAIESLLIGQQDPVSGATILFAHVYEDPINRGNVTAYIDDGTGSAESIARTAVALSGTWTWNNTTTVLTTNTTGVTAGTFIRKDSSPLLFFEVSVVVPNTSVTILNPGTATIPTGAGASSKATEKLTLGLDGPPPDTAVGGETTLYLDQIPIKASEPIALVSSIRGPLVLNTDYILNTASGQIDFTPALVNSEIIIADYTYFTGVIAFAQKLVDGDPNDRTNYPGYRAAGVLVIVDTPQVLLQTVQVSITVKDGYDQTDAKNLARTAIKDYINGLGISGDVILSELTKRIMEVAGIYDVDVILPASNIILLDDQLARITDPNILIV